MKKIEIKDGKIFYRAETSRERRLLLANRFKKSNREEEGDWYEADRAKGTVRVADAIKNGTIT